MKIQFKNVGSNGKSWVAETRKKEITYDFLYNQAKTAILSSDIDFAFYEDTQKGVIFEDGFRAVGEFEVIE